MRGFQEGTQNLYRSSILKDYPHKVIQQMFLSFVAEVLRVVQQLPGAGDDTRRTIERDIVGVKAVDIYMITVSSKLRRAI